MFFVGIASAHTDDRCSNDHPPSLASPFMQIPNIFQQGRVRT